MGSTSVPMGYTALTRHETGTNGAMSRLGGQEEEAEGFL